jgi:phosphate transport system substrate-binding protein
MRNKISKIIILLFMFMFMFIANYVVATEFVLKDGSVIKGVLASSANGTCVVTRLGGQPFTLNCTEIVQMKESALPADALDNAKLNIAGSNTVGAKLMPALLIDYVRRNGATQTPDIPRIKGPDEMLIEPRPQVSGLWNSITINAHGSSTGFQGLAALALSRQAPDFNRLNQDAPTGCGHASPDEAVLMPRNETADLWKNIQTGCSDRGAAAPSEARKPLVHLAMSSRRVTPNEITTLEPLGLMDNPASERVIALDGLAIVINRANKVETLTREQIMKIFTGKITNWEQVGGWPGPIAMYARKDGSGTLDTFTQLVLKGAAMPSTVKRIEDSRELSDAVARDPDAIGFIGMSYVGEAKAVNIRECNLVYPPNSFNAKTEEYPLARRLFLYAPQIRNKGIDSFLDYINTDEAQRVVARNGFVDLSIEPDFIGSQRALRSVSREAGRNSHEDDLYAAMIKEGGRLSITLRFRANSSDINQMDLDSRAIHDLQRLKDYMRSLKGRAQRVRLVGFSDSAGDYARNRMLSLERANYIARELKDVPQAGVMGLGPNFAVACNDSDEGRSKNRRVEIWLTK